MSVSDEDLGRLLRQGADQAEMSAKDLAQLLGTFRKELIQQGFDGEQTWHLCCEFFDAMLDNGAAVAEEDDD